MSILQKGIWRVVFLGLALLVIIIQLFPAFSSDNRELNTLNEDQFIEHLDERIPVLLDAYSIPGVSIAIIKDGVPLWSKAYGYADKQQNRRMSAKAVFRVESISKSVTAWGIMHLVQQGLIGLDRLAQEYFNDWSFPESEYPQQEITVSQLLSHTAGLSLGTIGEEYAPDGKIPELKKYLTREFELVQAPGGGFNYSNTGFNVLHLLIEEVTGRDFAEYMAEEVLTPLKMYQSGFAWADSLSTVLPMAYESDGRPVAPYVYPALGAGGLFATVDDVARFAIAGLKKSKQPILDPEILQEMYLPRVYNLGVYQVVADAYGFGHFVEFLPNGMKAVWHGGQGHGWMTHFHAVPEADDAIVILTNSARSWPFMAYILEDWSQWRGLGPVKFSRITAAVAGMKVINSLIFLLSIYLMVIIGLDFKTGKRKLGFALAVTSLRLRELIMFIVIAALLLWSNAQDYLMITSIFPVESARLGWALLLLAVVLLVSVLFPVIPRIGHSVTKSP